MKAKAKELNNKNEVELKSFLKEERQRLLNLRMRQTGTQLKNVREIREVRKNIARVLTVIGSKKI